MLRHAASANPLSIEDQGRLIMRNVIYKTATLPASGEELFGMYLDSSTHAAFTGMPAQIGKENGSSFTAFDGMLNGTMLHIAHSRLIVQSWRSVAFKDEDPDSTLIISFTSKGNAGHIDLVHLDVPDHDMDGVTKGWDERYFAPWRSYLQNR